MPSGGNPQYGVRLSRETAAAVEAARQPGRPRSRPSPDVLTVREARCRQRAPQVARSRGCRAQRVARGTSCEGL